MSKGFTKGEDSHAPLDINEYLVTHPSSTFYIQSEEDGPEGSGIVSGDMLAIDRSRTPKAQSVVLAVIEEEMRLGYGKEVSEGEVWGVVIGIVRKF